MSRIVFATVLLLVLSAAVLPAASAEEPATKRVVYRDDAGEDPGAPDITSVAVSSGDAFLSFRLSIPTHPVLTEDLRIRVWLDADDDPETGLSVEGRGGLDTFLLIERWELGYGEVGVFRCSASSCSGGRKDSVDFTYSSGATLTFNPVALGLGRVERFRFSAEVTAGIRFDPASRRYDFADARRDLAPAEGGYWTYDTRVAVVQRFSATPTTPAAGKPFALRMRVIRTDTGAGLTGAKLLCSCRIAGKPLRPRSRRFVREQAVCIFDIPTTARGRRFRSSISVRSPGVELLRSVSGTVR